MTTTVPSSDRVRPGVLRGLVGVAVAAVLALGWLLVPTTSTSAATIYLQTTSDDAAALVPQTTFQHNQLQSYSALAHGSLVTRAAVREAGVDVEPAALSRALSVQVVPQTVILRVGVTDRSPRAARLLADAVARQVVAQGNALQRSGSDGTDPARLVLLDSAGEPTGATSRLRGVVLAVLVGVLVALALPSRLPRSLPRRPARRRREPLEPGA